MPTISEQTKQPFKQNPPLEGREAQNQPFLVSWSGGKDSCFAMMQMVAAGNKPVVLLNALNESGLISRSHGVPSFILQAQAAAVDLPIHFISASWTEYEAKFIAALTSLKETYGVTTAVFGDIDLQAHKDWEEKVCSATGLTASLPLWQQNRKILVQQMLEAGIETMIVSCNDQMGEHYLGKILTMELAWELDTMGIDMCGENGEFHTLVLNCPMFKNKIDVQVVEKVKHDKYWFCVLA